MAFTLSQAGMVMHWHKQMSDKEAQGGGSKNKAGAGGALFINGLGAVCTALALGVILVAKFAEGAWITVPVLVALMALFFSVRRHYDAVAEQIGHPHPLDLSHNDPPVAVVALGGWNIVSERALHFGMRLSPNVYAVYIKLPDANGKDEEGEKKAQDLRGQWAEQVDKPAQAAGLPLPHLEVLSSPYRKVSGPLTAYLKQLKGQYPDRLIAVIIPELVETRWWDWLLHNHRATALKANLLLLGDPRIVVINVPWYVQYGKAARADQQTGK